MNKVLAELEKSIGYQFVNKELLGTALTHCSIARDNNERLEYLGDAVLGFIITAELYQQFPLASEGELTRMRAFLVKKETLVKLANELNLGNFVRLGPGEVRNAGGWRSSMLADTLEAVIGAIYLDVGLEPCRLCTLTLYDSLLSEISPKTLKKDPKTRLQEMLQARNLALPVYEVIHEDGEVHARTFTVECEIKAFDIVTRKQGLSKRAAEQSAANEAVALLEETLFQKT